MGISLIILNKKIDRFKLTKNLEKNGVETRPIISGNFVRQPAIKLYKIKHDNSFKQADDVYNSGFFIGLPFRKLTIEKIKYLIYAFKKSIRSSIKN